MAEVAVSGTTLALLLALLSVQAVDDGARQDFDRAVLRQKQGKWEEAATRYREILSDWPDFVPARLYLAESLWLSGNPEAARQELVTARLAVPSLLLPMVLLAQLEGGDPAPLEEAVPNPRMRARLINGMRLEGESFVPMERSAILLLAMGAVEPALEDYQAISKVDPENAELHRKLGGVLAKARRPLESAQAFERVVSLEPRDARSWGQLGSSYLRLMWWEPAIEAFQAALDIEGEKPAGLLALGYALEQKPDFEAALRVYERAARLQPSWAQAPYRVGKTLIKLSRRDEAEAALKRAVELDPKMVEAVCFLGSVYLENGEIDAATRELENAVALDPRYSKAHFYLGQAYLRAGREEEARKALAAYERLNK